MPEIFISLINAPLFTMALRLAFIALLTLLARYGVRLAARQVAKRLERTTPNPERFARLQTLVQAGRSAAWVLTLLVAGLMALHTLGIDITPLLAGAGVAGLALSLGAQTLIKDFIGGTLILIENQFTVGDVIKVGEAAGGVERITLRATYLRDVEGKQHIVPNGDIRTVSNLTAEWARAVVDLNVAYEADMGKVLHALEAAAARVQQDEAIKADLLEAPQALGWIGFKDWAVQVRVMAKTKPGKQWDVMMALRRCAVEALQTEGVKVALPAQSVMLDSSMT
jgi:small conductance mechanosensitive channel